MCGLNLTNTWNGWSGMESISGRYHSYLLRMWQVDEEPPTWRASLEDARTGQRHGFGDLESLFRFLAEQAGGSSEAGEDSAEPTGVPGSGPDRLTSPEP